MLEALRAGWGQVPGGGAPLRITWSPIVLARSRERARAEERMPMRVAILADIHGNHIALDAVLADLRAQNVDQTVCLGDAIQGGPQPAETVAALRALACPIVVGNADDWLLTGEDSGAEPITEQQRAARDWSLARLSDEDRDFIRTFQPTVTLEVAGGTCLLCFHGSPASFDDVILPQTPDAEVVRLLGGSGARFLAGGHTHVQQIRRVGDALFINPGSVGLAYSDQQPAGSGPRADPWAEYALLEVADDGRASVTFRRVPFDLEALIQVYQTSGRPYSQEAVAQYRGVPPAPR